MGPFLTNIKIERYNLLLDYISDNKFPLNRLTPNDPYMCRTAPLISKRCILFIYSTNKYQNILNMLYTLRCFLFKMQFVS